ncbi:MAG: NADH-quinone oxidoreductase subunit J [Bacteroidota bacterium]|nr:NADH-quinone oxidoreductase subunit J [Bacteroidota bacterium]
MFDIIFYIFGAITVGGALVTAFARNIVYAAFSLLFSFFGIAGLYIMANADFLAVTQLLVYVGGILILLIFGVMLTSRIGTVDIRVGTGSRWVAGIMALGLFAILCAAFFGTAATHTEKSADGKSQVVTSWATHATRPWSGSKWNQDATTEALKPKYGAPDEVKSNEGSSGTSVEIGTLFLTDYLLPFEVISVLILVSLLGATMIARKEPTKEEEAIAESVSV